MIRQSLHILPYLNVVESDCIRDNYLPSYFENFIYFNFNKLYEFYIIFFSN